MLKMWLACPYSLNTSGHSVFCARCSSSGGPATADGIGFGARSGPCKGLLDFRPNSVKGDCKAVLQGGKDIGKDVL